MYILFQFTSDLLCTQLYYFRFNHCVGCDKQELRYDNYINTTLIHRICRECGPTQFTRRDSHDIPGQQKIKKWHNITSQTLARVLICAKLFGCESCNPLLADRIKHILKFCFSK